MRGDRVALPKTRAAQEPNQQLYLAMHRKIAESITSILDLKEILRLITDKSVELFDMNWCRLYFYDEVTDELTYQVVYPVPGRASQTLKITPSPLARKALSERRLVYVEDTTSWHEDTKGSWSEEGMRSAVYLPLVVRGRPIGLILLASTTSVRHFESEHIDLLASFASQAAIAIDNARLRDRLQSTLEQLFSLYQAGRAVSSSIDIDDVLRTVVHSVKQLFEADCCAIGGLDVDGRLATLKTSGVDESRYLSWRESEIGRRYFESALAHEDGHGSGTVRRLALPESRGIVQWAPLLVAGKAFGTIELYSRDEGSLSVRSGELLSALAGQVAVAMENARLHSALSEKERQLQLLVQRLLQAEEEERRSFACDVHDGLLQLILASDLPFQTYQAAHSTCSPGAREELDRGMTLLHRAISESRRLISNLLPLGLDCEGLGASLHRYLDELSRDAGWDLRYYDGIDGRRFPRRVEMAVFRIVQEAVTNAKKHAKSKRLAFRISQEAGTLLVEVRDFGVGFASSRAFSVVPGYQTVGIVGMRERARVLGGQCEVSSAPGAGTTVRISIPVDEVDQREWLPAESVY